MPYHFQQYEDALHGHIPFATHRTSCSSCKMTTSLGLCFAFCGCPFCRIGPCYDKHLINFGFHCPRHGRINYTGLPILLPPGGPPRTSCASCKKFIADENQKKWSPCGCPFHIHHFQQHETEQGFNCPIHGLAGARRDLPGTTAGTSAGDTSRQSCISCKKKIENEDDRNYVYCGCPIHVNHVNKHINKKGVFVCPRHGPQPPLD
ncbi:hypothetical protein GPALN_002975 [Globodera pallida]|nr:hypothetical protein GPALN_002975 [Globodera pallida]